VIRPPIHHDMWHSSQGAVRVCCGHSASSTAVLRLWYRNWGRDPAVNMVSTRAALLMKYGLQVLQLVGLDSAGCTGADGNGTVLGIRLRDFCAVGALLSLHAFNGIPYTYCRADRTSFVGVIEGGSCEGTSAAPCTPWGPPHQAPTSTDFSCVPPSPEFHSQCMQLTRPAASHT
jgi:hypothetical protein